MSKLAALCHGIDWINDKLGRTVWVIFIPLTLITTYEVCMRYFFSAPTVWAWDVLVQLQLVIVTLGVGYTLLNKGHVRMDVIWARFSPRVRAILDLITHLLFFYGVGMLFWLSLDEAIIATRTREVLSTLWGPPIYPARIIMAIGILLFLLQGLNKFIRDIDTVRTGKEST